MRGEIKQNLKLSHEGENPPKLDNWSQDLSSALISGVRFYSHSISSIYTIVCCFAHVLDANVLRKSYVGFCRYL